MTTSAADALRARAQRVFVTSQGDEIQYRRLLFADVADLSDVWPIFNLAVYYALRNGKEPEKHAPWIKEYDDASKRFDERTRNRVELICRAAIEPTLIDPATTKHPPEDAVPYYALSELDINRFVNEIIVHASGLEPAEQEDEARRAARFRDGATVSDGDGGGEAIGEDASGTTDDRQPVDGNGVDAHGGILGQTPADYQPPQTDA